ncbi:MAG: glycosyltransferase family 2 protein [Dehalococcoidia bacterium]
MVIRVPVGHDVDVSVVAWNSSRELRNNLPAMIAQDYPSYRVVVVDNASDDATADLVEEEFPDVTLIRSPRNGGFGAGNNLCFERSRSAYVAVLNPDARPERGWLRALVRALEAHPGAAMATSKVLLASDPARVNACGNEVHMSGIAFCRGLGDDQHAFVSDEHVAAVSGAAFVARRDVLDEIGFFDERFFMYLEDTELSLRARLAGYDVICANRSRVLHDYALSVPPWKFYYLERNRFFMLLNLYRWRTLALLAPALLLAEAGVWCFALRSGRAMAGAKARSYASVLLGLPLMLRHRRRTQRLRRVPDRALLDVLCADLPSGLEGAPALLTKAANTCFRLYATLLRRAVRW